MSAPGPRRARFLALLALGVAAPPLLVASGGARQPELAVRTVGLFAHSGFLQAARPLGQSFLCRGPGLERIELRVQALGPLAGTALELVLRADGPRGEVLRRARFRPGVDRPRGGRASFDFEPLEDSAGRVLHLELSPGEGAEELPLAVWLRPRAQPGATLVHKDELLEGESHVLDFQSPHPDLSGVALFCARLAPEEHLRVSLQDETGASLREAELTGWSLREGHALLRFEPPLAESYARRLRLVIEHSPGAALRGRHGSPSHALLHGRLAADEALGTLVRGEQAVLAADLAFRAYTRREALASLRSCAGPRTLLAWLAWISLVATVLAAPRRPHGRTARPRAD